MRWLRTEGAGLLERFTPDGCCWRSLIRGYSRVAPPGLQKGKTVENPMLPGGESEPPYVGCYGRKRKNVLAVDLRARVLLSGGRCCAEEGFALEMVWRWVKSKGGCGRLVRFGD
jgi:hypothetical protein